MTDSELITLLAGIPVVPVLVIEDVAHAVPLARALVAGGLRGDRDHAAHAGRARGDPGDRGRGGGRHRRRRHGAEHRRSCRAAARPGARFVGLPRRDADACSMRPPRCAGAAPAGRRHRVRSRCACSSTATAPEILPGRAGRRRRLPEGARLAASRQRASARPAGIDAANAPAICAAERGLRRRLLGRAEGAVAAGDWQRIKRLARDAAALSEAEVREHACRLTAALPGGARAPCRDHRAAVHLRDLFADDPDRFERFSLTLGDLLLDYSKNRITAETLQLLLALAEAGRCRGLARQDVRRRADQHHRGPRRPARRAAQPRQPADPRRRRGRHAGGATPCSSGCATSPSACAAASGRGTRGETDHRRRQHRHRRLRPRPGDGHRGAAALPAAPDLRAALRLQRRRRPPRRHAGAASTRSARCSSSRRRPSPPRRR